MRVLLILLLGGVLAAPALAGPWPFGCGCGYRTRSYRSCAYRYRPVYRGYRYRYGYGFGYGYRACAPRYGAYGYRYGYRRYRARHFARTAIVPFYTRFTTVLTLDDEAFDGPPEPAK